ncbi:MAG: 4Fe-4S ferredoxin [Bacteroidales bacterium]|nr:4Fe-4S ferredoxin [Bacteroidales bacterium]
MKRTVVKIDEKLCNGCGICVTGCHEGALQMIDGKAVMVSDLYCDGLGACIPDCPLGAISLEEREAEAYNEEAVMERIAPKGDKVILAHLKHLQDHGETGFMNQGIDYLKKHNIKVDLSSLFPTVSKDNTFVPVMHKAVNFPFQLHLINPLNSVFAEADLLLAADCTAFTATGFHNRFLKDKVLAIACPKLDSNRESYIEKLAVMIDQTKIETLTVLVMDVPCCSGLMELVRRAREKCQRYIPVKKVIITVKGNVKSEEWIQ